MNLRNRELFFNVDRLINGFAPYRQHSYLSPSNSTETDSDAYSPRVDIQELADNYLLIAELPGISKENISVTVDDKTLCIEASNEPDHAQTDAQVVRAERRFGKFSRRFKLGKNIEQADIKANFKDGLLQLSIPKTKLQESKTNHIEIH